METSVIIITGILSGLLTVAVVLVAWLGRRLRLSIRPTSIEVVLGSRGVPPPVGSDSAGANKYRNGNRVKNMQETPRP